MTPAPWHVRPEESGNFEVRDDSGNWIARVHFRNGPGDAEAESNAQAIAAVPALVEACEVFLAAIESKERALLINAEQRVRAALRAALEVSDV